MKKLTIVVAILVLMTGSASAEGMMFGFKGGLNIANISGDDTDFLTIENSSKMAFGGGVFLNVPLTEALSIQPEALFMMKGTKWDFDGDELLFNLNYVDLNLLAKFSIPLEGNISPFLAAGPQLGFLMKAEFDGGGETLDVKDYTKSFDYGVALGAGFDLMTASGVFTFDARYVLGLSSIDEAEEGEEEEDLKNTGIMLLVGYGYAF